GWAGRRRRRGVPRGGHRGTRRPCAGHAGAARGGARSLARPAGPVAGRGRRRRRRGGALVAPRRRRCRARRGPRRRVGARAARRVKESTMEWNTLATTLFGTGHEIVQDGDLLQGTVVFDGDPLAVVGTTNHAPIGVRLALAQARVVLDTIARHPGRAILLLIDTQGQQLRRRDELLGINRAMAHLGMAIDLARRRGHRVLGLVYDQALSGGFITSGLIADACDALPEAAIRVMRIPAMARVTKLPEALLTELSRANPVFAPGVDNYVAMNGVRTLWHGDLTAALRQALTDASAEDRRTADGASRGGRRMAASV